MRSRVQGPGSRAQGSGFRVQGSGFNVEGLGFRVQCSGFRVWGPGCRVEGFESNFRTSSVSKVDGKPGWIGGWGWGWGAGLGFRFMSKGAGVRFQDAGFRSQGSGEYRPGPASTPLSSKYVTCKTVKPRFWLWRPGGSPSNLLRS